MGGIDFTAMFKSLNIGFDINKFLAPPLVAIFVGCISHIIFAAMARIILHTINSVFLCYAVEKDAEQAEQQRFTGAGGLYVVLAETPAMQKFHEGSADANSAHPSGAAVIPVATEVVPV